MDYIPDDAYYILKQYKKKHISMPPLQIKLYAYQMCRALAYIHASGICHRDIKPQNILITTNHQLVLCDFGSAKYLVPNEPNVAYICSRYYRAPELIFGATEYTTMIDVWSMGCVIGEFILGCPLFSGENNTDQLVRIVKTLGTPTNEQIFVMNPKHRELKFPSIKAKAWAEVFKFKADELALDFLSKILVYEPNKRLRCMDALSHPWFDELRDQRTTLHGRPLPDLFNFTKGYFLLIS